MPAIKSEGPHPGNAPPLYIPGRIRLPVHLGWKHTTTFRQCISVSLNSLQVASVLKVLIKWGPSKMQLLAAAKCQNLSVVKFQMQWQQDPHQNARDSTVVPHISSYITDPNVVSDYHYEVPCLHSVNFAFCRHGKQNDQRSSDHSQNTVSLCTSFPVMWTVYIAIKMNNESTRVEYDSSKQFVSSIQDFLNVATSKHCQLDKPTVPVRQHLAVFVFVISLIMLKCDIFMSKLTSGKLRIAESSTVIVFRKAWFGLFCTLLDKIDWFDCNHRCSNLARSWSKARG